MSSPELANDFNQYYVDKIVKLRNTIPCSDQYVSDVQFSGTTLDIFEPATEEEIRKLLKANDIKTAVHDPIPASLLKLIVEEAVPVLTQLVNLSLSTGSIEGVKTSIINPLLKKCGLDVDDKKSYRPVSNLLFISKLTERVVLERLEGHMVANSLHCKSQFGYKKFHSTETMMLGLVDDVLTGFDIGLCTIIILLDLSAAFDTIDFEIMLRILHDELGVRGIALKWFASFLRGRKQQVKIDNSFSDILNVMFGAPQDSVLGPKLFSIYVRGQPKVFETCSFKPASFADDSNGTKQFALTFQCKVLIDEIPQCIDKITDYMNIQYLKINPEKTEFVLLHPKHFHEKIIIKGTFINGKCIRFSKLVKNVGLWIDQNLELDSNINKIVSHCYKLLKDIGRIRPILTKEHTESLVHAVITSRLDSFNSLYININKSSLNKLQKVQNASARLIVKLKRTKSVRVVLRDLHCLPVESRILFKILLITHKVVYGRCSSNLSVSFKSGNCRPQNLLMLNTTRCATKYGKRTFSWSAPRLWNLLPVDMRSCDNTDTFKKKLKTLLFANTNQLIERAFHYQ